MSGRRVEFQERIGGGEWRLRAVRVSDDTGRVSATLAREHEPAHPARRRGHRTGDRGVQPRRRGGRSRAGDAAREPGDAAQRAGRPVLGRLLGGHVPRHGRELELQGYNPLKGRWQPVRTQGLRTAGSGRWATTYRFTATVGATVTYRFRVRVAPRPDHPFAQGFSRTVRVTVRG